MKLARLSEEKINHGCLVGQEKPKTKVAERMGRNP